MARLCERPDCSDEASVAYGMRPEDLVFWLDVLRAFDDSSGVLCARHADSMVLPRGWTLDDLRDPDLHLFRPPAAQPVERRRRPPRRPGPAGFDQLQLDAANDDHIDVPVDVPDRPDVDEGAAEPWNPEFDPKDDLDGLLSARSPLLARAFRGDDRPR